MRRTREKCHDLALDNSAMMTIRARLLHSSAIWRCTGSDHPERTDGQLFLSPCNNFNPVTRQCLGPSLRLSTRKTTYRPLCNRQPRGNRPSLNAIRVRLEIALSAVPVYAHPQSGLLTTKAKASRLLAAHSRRRLYNQLRSSVSAWYWQRYSRRAFVELAACGKTRAFCGCLRKSSA